MEKTSIGFFPWITCCFV